MEAATESPHTARLPDDPEGFVALAERITNERDLDQAVGVYSDDVRLETLTDGALEVYSGSDEVRRAWDAYLGAFAAREFLLRKRLLAAAGDTIVNEWHGTLGGRTQARGVEWWRFDADGKVAEHVLMSYMNVRPSTSWVQRARLSMYYPLSALALLREQKRAFRG